MLDAVRCCSGNDTSCCVGREKNTIYPLDRAYDSVFLCTGYKFDASLFRERPQMQRFADGQRHHTCLNCLRRHRSALSSKLCLHALWAVCSGLSVCSVRWLSVRVFCWELRMPRAAHSRGLVVVVMDKSALCWLAWRAVGEAFPDAPARLDNDDERGFTSKFPALSGGNHLLFYH